MSDRRDFELVTGRALYSDVNRQMVAELQGQAPQDLTGPSAAWDVAYKIGLEDPTARRVAIENPAGTSLRLAIQALPKPDPKAHHDRDFKPRYGLTSEEMQEAHRHAVVNAGFDDLDFTWHFSGALANAVVDQRVADGYMTQTQKDAYTLPDWISLIRSDWFNALAHDMAKSREGTYANFGRLLRHYEVGALALYIKDVVPITTQLFETNKATGVVALTPKARLTLHHSIGESSVGCPAAHRGGVISRALFKTNPHVQALVDEGVWRAAPDDSDKVRIHIIETAIDHTLAFVTSQLADYHERYGTPRLTKTSLFFELKHIPGEARVNNSACV